MPALFAVVAERSATAGPHAEELGAVGAAGGYDGVGAVGRRTPASV